MPSSAKNRRLHDMLQSGKIVVAPGVGDALGARMVEWSGFEVVYMSGYSVAATFARPDVGLTTFSETLERTAQIAAAVNIPLVADIDDGYGNAINVARSVREFERVGVSGVQLEDQRSPKKCGAMAGKTLLPIPEMVGKIKAALDARRDPNFKLIARTDAIESVGFEEAIERACAYRDAGADLLMFTGPKTEDDISRLVAETRHPVVYLNSDSLNRPHLPVSRLQEMGLAMVVFPLTATLVAAKAALEALGEIKRTGASLQLRGRMVSWDELNEIVGLAQVQAASEAYKG